jgi:anti-anti-sigma factor
MAVERTLAEGSDNPSGAGPARPAGLAGPAGVADWRGDVALELWVETDKEPARVRLAGRLDSTTAANLSQVMTELLSEGRRRIELVTEGLRVVDASALGALADIERQVRRGGGTLTRVGPSMGPFTRVRRGVTPPAPRT